MVRRVDPVLPKSVVMDMNLKLIGQASEEGGCWSEMPWLATAAIQTQTMRDLRKNFSEVMQSYLGPEKAHEHKNRLSIEKAS